MRPVFNYSSASVFEQSTAMSSFTTELKDTRNHDGLPQYNSNWGNIVILSLGTFIEWWITCEIALMNAGVLNIADGIWKKPIANDYTHASRPNTQSVLSGAPHNEIDTHDNEFRVHEKKWLSKARDTQIIISNSIETQLMEQSLGFLRIIDPAGYETSSSQWTQTEIQQPLQN